jgi:hypothetical protein
MGVGLLLPVSPGDDLHHRVIAKVYQVYGLVAVRHGKTVDHPAPEPPGIKIKTPLGILYPKTNMMITVDSHDTLP